MKCVKMMTEAIMEWDMGKSRNAPYRKSPIGLNAAAGANLLTTAKQREDLQVQPIVVANPFCNIRSAQ
jgi:hypothetical protein